MTMDSRTRWLALYVLCLGDLMIVLDGTIVNVALPSIRDDLGFSQTSLAWVVNAYLLTFGGFLLLGGRLGDLFGHRRLFLIGISVFTAASLACGLATSQTFLIAARAVQGFGGAIVSVVVLSLIMIMFTEPAERAKAMGVVGFVLSGGGTAGVLLGGILTDLLSWHWIFLVNIPVGVTVFVLSVYLCPTVQAPSQARRSRCFSSSSRSRRATRLPSCLWACSGTATSPSPTWSGSSWRRRCSRCSSSRRSISNWCSTTARSKWGLRSCPRRSSGERPRFSFPTASSCASASSRRSSAVSRSSSGACFFSRERPWTEPSPWTF